jgi:predicted transcriptional regulator of viral defense system
VQHGVVALGQLQAAGLSSGAVAKRARRGRLHRVHRGVYAVGHASLTYRGRCMAAVLALSGTGGNRRPSGLSWGTAIVSHRSAAMLWGLLPPTAGTIHVSIRDGSGREPRRGICVHRRAALPTKCVAGRHGIPVTTVAQTIADLRTSISSGATVASSSRPTTTNTTEAKPPSRTTAPETWICAASATTSYASPTAK